MTFKEIVTSRYATKRFTEKKISSDDFYAEYSTHHQSCTHMRMLRTAEWKLVRGFLDPERDDLYNLIDDPAETTNLIASTSPEVKRVINVLHEKILARMRENNDSVLNKPQH